MWPCKCCNSYSSPETTLIFSLWPILHRNYDTSNYFHIQSLLLKHSPPFRRVICTLAANGWISQPTDKERFLLRPSVLMNPTSAEQGRRPGRRRGTGGGRARNRVNLLIPRSIAARRMFNKSLTSCSSGGTHRGQSLISHSPRAPQLLCTHSVRCSRRHHPRTGRQADRRRNKCFQSVLSPLCSPPAHPQTHRIDSLVPFYSLSSSLGHLPLTPTLRLLILRLANRLFHLHTQPTGRTQEEIPRRSGLGNNQLARN